MLHAWSPSMGWGTGCSRIDSDPRATMTTGRRWSLSRRVALVAVIVLAGWVVVLTVGVNLVVTARLAGEADNLLRTEAQLTADTTEIATDLQLIIPTSTS